MKKKVKEIKYWFEENILNSTYKTMIVLFISTLIFVGLVSIIIFLIEPAESSEPSETVVATATIELIEPKELKEPIETIEPVKIIATIATTEPDATASNDNKKDFNVFKNFYLDNLFTAINAWYPEILEDQTLITTYRSYGLKVLVALFGLFFTSIIIGFVSEKISSAFEEIRNDNRKIIENEHIVILGYTFGDCKVIEELIAMTSKKIVIVVADNSSKSEIHEDIKARLDIPKNVKLIIQSLDVTDYNMLEYCSIEKSRAVIINTLDDNKTIKTVLAVSHIIAKYNCKDIKVVSAVKDKENILPYNKEANIIAMISLENFIARILAKTINKNLVYNILLQLLSFKGAEFYENQAKDFTGKTFEYVCNNFSNAIPVGIMKNDKFIFVSDNNYLLSDEDSIVYIADEKYSYRIIHNEHKNTYDDLLKNITKYNKNKKILIIGHCNSYDILLNELNYDEVNIMGKNEDEHNIIKESINNSVEEKDNIKIMDYVNLNRENLEKIVLNDRYDEIVVLSNDIDEDEDSDIEIMKIALHLRDIRRLNDVNFHMIVTLNDDRNRELLDMDEFQNIIVSNNIVHAFLPQLALNNKLKPLFMDILSKDGINIDIINVTEDIGKKGSINVGKLRRTLLNKHYIYVGHINKNDGNVIIDSDVHSRINLDKDMGLVVISNET